MKSTKKPPLTNRRRLVSLGASRVTNPAKRTLQETIRAHSRINLPKSLRRLQPAQVFVYLSHGFLSSANILLGQIVGLLRDAPDQKKSLNGLRKEPDAESDAATSVDLFALVAKDLNGSRATFALHFLVNL